ncbi:MAG: hypothetical protein A2021_06290 [Elusimicrobia bacterium GWF2_52_66]|nr:MAG: hypothetical protein A2X33_02930 [Elusimicrobia bacterium GWA2_51_34]OGR86582.1 MAG: hypothetical protein A2021_06290 [Elusimicrobia bacterium GWF2_52_66]HAF95635.1 hypothetical protein [Elusimicrobiota bacterium]HCE97674.1 hypothetical protein [Elusimicrobiota bacterium]
MEDFSAIGKIFDRAGFEGRFSLSETEVYEVLKAADLNVPEYILYPAAGFNPDTAAQDAVSRLSGCKLVIKLVSSKTLHKTESGGVKIILKDTPAVAQALRAMKAAFPDAEGFMAAEFAEHSAFSLGEELMLGARSDDAFGPVITLGVGGTNAEDLTRALKEGLSPSIMPAELACNRKSWQKFLSGSWVWRYCSGSVRGGRRLAEDGEIFKWLETFTLIMKHFSDGGVSKWAVTEFEVNPLAVSNGALVALDGVLRFRAAKNNSRRLPSKKGIAGLLKPSSAAVVGVSEKKMNMARIILNNIAKAGFPKEHTYIIKAGAGEIDGVKCFASPSLLPETVDMYVVAVPSPEVPRVLAEAGDCGKVNGVVLISGGMGEKEGSEDLGRGVTAAVELARQKNPDFVLSGGNSLGIVLNEARINTLFIPEYKMAHPLGVNANMVKTAFVSQSGAFVISAESRMPWLKPAYSITVGNQQDITVADYLDTLADEEGLKVLLVYIEGFKYGDGLALADIIKRARKNGKQVVLYKAGRTVVGRKAVMGHTASIAGDYLVTKIILEAAGALVAESFDDFNDYALLACHFAGLEIKNRNTFFISNAGFEAAGMADGVKGGLCANLDDEGLKAALKKVLVDFKLDSIVDVKNPMDITPMASDGAIGEIIRKALLSPEFGGAVVAMIPLTAAMDTLPKGEGRPDDLERSFLKEAAAAAKSLKKPLVFCVASGRLYDPYCDHALALGLPVFRSADRAVKVYRKYLEYVQNF